MLDYFVFKTIKTRISYPRRYVIPDFCTFVHKCCLAFVALKFRNFQIYRVPSVVTMVSVTKFFCQVAGAQRVYTFEH